ncbi:MAG: hypothetical protein HRF50_14760 [Phycisphaerae bacterium]|jgi:hypothetical protein
MTSIFEITDWSHVASFFVWTLAVCAIAKALFGSLPAAELQYRLSLRDAPRRQRLNRLNWEIGNRTKWDEDVARRSPHAARQPLSDEAIKSKRRELQQLAHSSFTWRAFTYFMGCFACQTFWTAVVVFAATHGVGDPVAWLFSAAAYSGAAVLAVPFVTERSGVRRTRTGEQTGCANCGR